MIREDEHGVKVYLSTGKAIFNIMLGSLLFLLGVVLVQHPASPFYAAFGYLLVALFSLVTLINLLRLALFFRAVLETSAEGVTINIFGLWPRLTPWRDVSIIQAILQSNSNILVRWLSPQNIWLTRTDQLQRSRQKISSSPSQRHTWLRALRRQFTYHTTVQGFYLPGKADAIVAKIARKNAEQIRFYQIDVFDSENYQLDSHGQRGAEPDDTPDEKTDD